MSILRVTDVQAALRHHQDLGHDVLSDSRAVHLDGKPYRLPVGHSLFLNGEGGSGELASYLMQSERPLVSTISSSWQTKGLNPGWMVSDRESSILVPHRNLNNRPGAQDFYAHHMVNDPKTNESHSLYIESTGSTPTGVTPTYSKHHGSQDDIHTALALHTTPEIPHTGKVQERPDVTGRGEFLASPRSLGRDMSSEELSSFDNMGALKTLVGEPFKGFVTIMHRVSNNVYNDYLYHPETEQLHRYTR